MAQTKKFRLIPEEQIRQGEQEILDSSKRIEFYTTEYSVELLFNKMEKEDFQIPDYQREFTWEPARQSKFIESILIGLPIPFLFFWEMGSGKLEIVDGSQRLRSIQAFINNHLKLIDLEKLPSLNGTRYNDLLSSRQRKFQNKTIRGIVLNELADDSARFDMFERINTGSKVANTTEVRRGALRGAFMDLVIELSKNSLFKELAPVSKKSLSERTPEELVTRYFAYGDGMANYHDSPKEFLFEYTKKMNISLNEQPHLINQLTDDFNSTMNFVKAYFPNGFRKDVNANSTPRVRFEAIAIGARNALKKEPNLHPNKNDIVNMLNSEEFKYLTTSDAANVKNKIIRRIQFVEHTLLGEI